MAKSVGFTQADALARVAAGRRAAAARSSAGDQQGGDGPSRRIRPGGPTAAPDGPWGRCPRVGVTSAMVEAGPAIGRTVRRQAWSSGGGDLGRAPALPVPGRRSAGGRGPAVAAPGLFTLATAALPRVCRRGVGRAHRGAAAGSDGPVTLLTDPAPTASGPAWRSCRDPPPRAWARGGGRGRWSSLGGERVWVVRQVRRHPTPRLARHPPPRRRARDRLGLPLVAGDPARTANRLRAPLAAGAPASTTTTQALFAGFVLGDDRGRSRSSPTTSGVPAHPLVVSGGNVAFVLALADPVVRPVRPDRASGGHAGGPRRLRARHPLPRPSVLRASAMAAVAVAAAAWGVAASGLRVLGLAVSSPWCSSTRSGAVPRLPALSGGVARHRGPGPPSADRFPGPGGGAPVASVPRRQPASAPPLADFGRRAVVAPWPTSSPCRRPGPISTTGDSPPGWWQDPAWSGGLHLPTRLLVGWVAGVSPARGATAPLGSVGPLGFAAPPRCRCPATRGRGREAPAARCWPSSPCSWPPVRLPAPSSRRRRVVTGAAVRTGALLWLGGRVRDATARRPAGDGAWTGST